MSKRLQWIFVGIIILLVIGIFIIFKPVAISGSAMEPTYQNGTNYLVNKLAYTGSSPKQGDVVTFRYTQNPKYSGIGRIIAGPNDKLIIKDGKVFLNGQVLRELYIAPNAMTKTASRSEIRDVNDETGKIEDTSGAKIIDEGKEITIPDRNYFIMGDNREESIDSRSLGFVDLQDIFGKVAFQYKLPF